MTKEIWQQSQFASEHYVVLQTLRDIILQGWPANRLDVPECIQPYFYFRYEFAVQDAFAFKRDIYVGCAAINAERTTCSSFDPDAPVVKHADRII